MSNPIAPLVANRSWKTTGAGLASILAAASGALTALTDNDPFTNPDWTAVIAAVIAGVGLLFARDNNRSSEQVGAVK